MATTTMSWPGQRARTNSRPSAGPSWRIVEMVLSPVRSAAAIGEDAATSSPGVAVASGSPAVCTSAAGSSVSPSSAVRWTIPAAAPVADEVSRTTRSSKRVKLVSAAREVAMSRKRRIVPRVISMAAESWSTSSTIEGPAAGPSNLNARISSACRVMSRSVRATWCATHHVSGTLNASTASAASRPRVRAARASFSNSSTGTAIARDSSPAVVGIGSTLAFHSRPSAASLRSVAASAPGVSGCRLARTGSPN